MVEADGVMDTLAAAVLAGVSVKSGTVVAPRLYPVSIAYAWISSLPAATGNSNVHFRCCHTFGECAISGTAKEIDLIFLVIDTRQVQLAILISLPS